MINLLAYMPVLNEQHRVWLQRHGPSNVFLITQAMAETFLPNLSRNIIALPTDIVVKMIQAIYPTYKVGEFMPEFGDPLLTSLKKKDWILADEDVSHFVADKYLLPIGCEVVFENIRARWDMNQVKALQPVIPDCEVSFSDSDILRVQDTYKLSEKSPDWWRQIAILAYRGTELLACGVNEHFPSSYETSVFGDPRLNFNAGDPSGVDAYVSLHAEEYLGAFCAGRGISLQGASVVINTFPCGRCARFLATTGISELFFFEGYSSIKGLDVLKGAGIRIVQVRNHPETAS